MTDALSRSRVTRPAVAAALLAALLLAAPIVKREWIASRFAAWAAHDLGGPPPLPWEPEPASGLCDQDCSAEALASSAVRLTIGAARTADVGQRRAQLAQADGRLSRALRVQPVAGGWWAWLAYVRSLEGGDPTGVLDALTRSYETAPFLSEEGPWRARMATLNWSRLSPRTRSQVIDEVIWMRDVDPDGFASALPAFVEPAAARALIEGLSRPPARLVPHRRSGAPGGVGATG
jgi:hypothetical protein